MEFPGFLVEKYLGYIDKTPNNTVKETYILITPKEINLEVGDLIEIDGVIYNLQLSHTLDDSKNEYEISMQRDV